MPYRHPWPPRFCAVRAHGGTGSGTRDVRGQGAPRNASGWGVIQSRRLSHRKRTMGTPGCSFVLFMLYTDSEMVGAGSTASSLPTSRFGDLGSKSAKMSGKGASDMVHALDLHNRDVRTVSVLRARHCACMCPGSTLLRCGDRLHVGQLTWSEPAPPSPSASISTNTPAMQRNKTAQRASFRWLTGVVMTYLGQVF